MSAGDLTSLGNVKQYLGLLGRNITAITRANPCVVTCPSHSLVSGSQVGITGVNGMSILNNQIFTIITIDANTFSLAVDSSNYTAYTSGGYVSTDDVILGRLINQTSQYIKGKVQRELTLNTYSEYYSTESGQNRVCLNEYPVNTVYTVTLDGVAIPESTNLSMAGWTLQSPNLLVFRNMVVASGVNNIYVSYSAGFSSPPVDIEQACIELTAWRYRERDRIGQENKSINGESVSFITNKSNLPHITDILDDYKRVTPRLTSGILVSNPTPTTQQATVIITTSTTSANQVVDSILASQFSAVQYLVQINSQSNYQISQITIASDGTNVSFSEYGMVSSGGILATFTADISSGYIRLLTTPTYAISVVKAFRTAIPK